MILVAIIPLMIRMALVHVILIYGTNNTHPDELSYTQILHRSTGSKLVLAARIFYAAFIWLAKLTVLEFLKRTIGARSWAKAYEIALRVIYGFLAFTFVAVVIGTLAECQPFDHYWQVVPDPGPKCREGLVQLITMGVCDMVTDLVLIIFPIPVVLKSNMQKRKKISLIVLFFLSIILIAVTAYRIPSTISRNSAQPFRSLIASLEILAASAVSNVVVIGSFIRDKGVKKAKFRAPAPNEPEDPLSRTQTRLRSITQHHWGSDEDLVGDMPMALPPTLRRGMTSDNVARAAPMAPPGKEDDLEAGHRRKSSTMDKKWDFANGHSRSRARKSTDSTSTTSTDIKLRDLQASLDEPVSPGADMDTKPLAKQMSFFDVGGLVDQPQSSPPSGNSREASIKSGVPSPRGRAGSKAFLYDIGGMLSSHKEEEHKPASTTSRSLTPNRGRERRKFSRSPGPSKLKAMETPKPPKKDEGPDSLSFGDIGGLLDR